MSKGYFITGTDTDVGKTLVTSALLHRFAEEGLKTIGMKPVAAGCVLIGSSLVSEDVTLLNSVSNISAPAELVNPYAFEPAIAPHIAAKLAGVDISIDKIKDAFEHLEQLADIVIVEGVGGFCVPLGEDYDTADLARTLDLPVIMVVGVRLGSLNHALLTQAAIKSQGLVLAGWIGSCIDPHMDALDENLLTLRRYLNAPCLGVIPWQENMEYTQASNFLDTRFLHR